LADHIEGIEDMRNLIEILVGKTEAKTPLGRKRCTLEHNIRKNLKKRYEKVFTGHILLWIVPL
jgi:hypothetical protein